MASPIPERASASPARFSPRPATHDPDEAAIVANQATTIIEADEGFDDGYQTDNNSTGTISLSTIPQVPWRALCFSKRWGQAGTWSTRWLSISVVESYILRLLGIIHRPSLILGPAREYGVWIIGARHKVGLLLECWLYIVGDEYPSAQVLGIDLQRKGLPWSNGTSSWGACAAAWCCWWCR
jgi:hypothetical protein